MTYVPRQGGGNGVSGALYITSMELSNQPPLLPQTYGKDALLIAALQGTPVPSLGASDVAVALGDSPGSSALAEVYAFGPSQPGIFLVEVRRPLAAYYRRDTAAKRPWRLYQLFTGRTAGAGDSACELHGPGQRQPAQPRRRCALDIPRRTTSVLLVCSCDCLAPIPAGQIDAFMSAQYVAWFALCRACCWLCKAL